MLPSRLTLGLALGALLAVALHASPALPAEMFTRRWAINDVQMSEDGRFLSYLTPGAEEHYDLNIHDQREKRTWKLNLRGIAVRHYRWVDATRLMVRYGNGMIEIYNASANRFTGTLRPYGIYSRPISSLRRDPSLFISQFYEEYLNSGDRTGLGIVNIQLIGMQLAGHKDRRYNVRSWIDLPRGEHRGTFTDLDGEVRLVTVYRDQRLQFHYRTSPPSPWQELPLNHDTHAILGFDDDPDYVFIARFSDDRQRSQLCRYRVSTGDFGPPLLEDDDYSFFGARLLQLRSPDGATRLLAVHYERDVPTQRALDPAFAQVQARINSRLPGQINLVEGFDYSLQRFLVSSQSGREPSRALIYDLSSDSLVAMPAPTPWFKAGEMSQNQPVTFTARDGLALHGYLSLPARQPAGAKPPLVVLCHGGPWTRDTWGFQLEVQFLTSRGYAVFQPNYRGSSGYSHRVSKADDFAFRKMHDDVTDGTRELVRQGLVDGNRVAILGHHFGGYLALSGVAYEPDLYRCAITFGGIFDWSQLLRQYRSDRDHDAFTFEYMRDRLGDPKANAAQLREMSPASAVSTIKAAVLVMHGKLDQRVDYEQSSRLIAQLKEHRIPHEKIFFDTEYHMLFEPENRLLYLKKLETFLDKNL